MGSWFQTSKAQPRRRDMHMFDKINSEKCLRKHHVFSCAPILHYKAQSIHFLFSFYTLNIQNLILRLLKIIEGDSLQNVNWEILHKNCIISHAETHVTALSVMLQSPCMMVMICLTPPFFHPTCNFILSLHYLLFMERLAFLLSYPFHCSAFVFFYVVHLCFPCTDWCTWWIVELLKTWAKV